MGQATGAYEPAPPRSRQIKEVDSPRQRGVKSSQGTPSTKSVCLIHSPCYHKRCTIDRESGGTRVSHKGTAMVPPRVQSTHVNEVTLKATREVSDVAGFETMLTATSQQ